MDDEDFGDGAPPVVNGVRPNGRGPRVARHSSHSLEKYEIHYRAVVQARLERVLVEPFLRRYSRGEAGEYVRRRGSDGKAQEEYLVGEKFPGVYYRSVRVCSNCYMVYALIDGARARSLQQRRYGSDGGKQRSTIPKAGSSLRPRCIDNHDRSKDKPTTDDLIATGDGGDSSSIVDRATTEDVRRGSNPRSIAGDTGPMCCPSSEDGHEHSPMVVSLAAARRAMDACSQGDISELRSFGHPPPVVSCVTSVAMTLIEGTRSSEKTAAASWASARTTMGRTDFLSRLRTLEPRAVRPNQMRAVESALGRPGFRPGIVRPLSNAAANLCLWVLGVVQAHQWMTGIGHVRTNLVPADDDILGWGESSCRKTRGSIGAVVWPKEPPFFPQQGLPPGHSGSPRKKRQRSPSRLMAGRNRDRRAGAGGVDGTGKGGGSGGSPSPDRTANDSHHVATAGGAADGGRSTWDLVGPATSPIVFGGGADVGFSASKETVVGANDAVTQADTAVAEDARGGRRRRRDGGKVAAQALASGRLMNPSQASVRGVAPAADISDFLCSDGKTRLPYRVCGEPAATGEKTASCNFVVVHDFFDNVDKTEVLFRPVTRQHRGCLVLAFSYPGQAGTVFGVPPSMRNPADGGRTHGGPGNGQGRPINTRSAGRGGSKGRKREMVPNNAFVAPRLHELLQHVHSVGEMRLSLPFHLVSLSVR